MTGNQALRIGRWSEQNRIYLVTVCTLDRQPFFSDFLAGRPLVAEMRKAQERGWADTLAYVIMPDHFHWLVSLHSQELARLVRHVKGAASRGVNRWLGRTGRLWQAGYHDRALRKEDELKHAARYVVANPLRAGLVERVGDYPLWDAVWLKGGDSGA